MNIVWVVLLFFLCLLIGGLYLIVIEVNKKNWIKVVGIIFALIILLVVVRYIVTTVIPGT